MIINVALIQMEPKHAELEYNRRRAEIFINKAMQHESRPDIVVLPENWTSVFSGEDEKLQAMKVREPITGASVKMMQRLAKQHHVWIAGGSITMQSGSEPTKNYNTLLLIDRKGNIVADYNKIHLCKWAGEDEAYAYGEKVVMADTEIGKLGLCICYDIRFPELTRIYAIKGAQILFVPACFGTYLSHWRYLLRARAMENQMFVVGCDCCGSGDTEYKFVGHSMVVAPNGEVLAEGADEEEIIHASLNLEEIEQVRSIVKYIDDRRPDIYQEYNL